MSFGVIGSDTCRGNHLLGCGNDRVHAPNLDRFAETRIKKSRRDRSA